MAQATQRSAGCDVGTQTSEHETAEAEMGRATRMVIDAALFAMQEAGRVAIPTIPTTFAEVLDPHRARRAAAERAGSKPSGGKASQRPAGRCESSEGGSADPPSGSTAALPIARPGRASALFALRASEAPAIGRGPDAAEGPLIRASLRAARPDQKVREILDFCEEYLRVNVVIGRACKRYIRGAARSSCSGSGARDDRGGAHSPRASSAT